MQINNSVGYGGSREERRKLYLNQVQKGKDMNKLIKPHLSTVIQELKDEKRMQKSKETLREYACK